MVHTIPMCILSLERERTLRLPKYPLRIVHVYDTFVKGPQRVGIIGDTARVRGVAPKQKGIQAVTELQ